MIRVRGTGLDVVWQPLLSVWLEDEFQVKALGVQAQDVNPRRSCGAPAADPQACIHLESGLLQVSLLLPLAENGATHKCLGGRGGHQDQSLICIPAPSSAPLSALSTHLVSSCATVQRCQMGPSQSESSLP